MKYYLIAGEASGDLHASNLIKELKKQDSKAEFRFWGGDEMETATNDKSVKHIKDLAFMGFIEVILNLKVILNNLKFCKHDIEMYKPDVLILVDYPGFNLRIAPFAKSLNLKVVWYISPQIWAWKEKRALKIKKYVDLMLCILPFEPSFYNKYAYNKVAYVGHPLLDIIADKDYTQNTKLGIALLPGSRVQEINKSLPIFLEVAKLLPNQNFTIAAVPHLPTEFYKSFNLPQNVQIVTNKTYYLLQNAKAALVTSGTATLETALYKVPQIVCYRANFISYHIAKKLIKVPYISLVNLIMNKAVIKELIQDEFTPQNCVEELNLILNGNKQLEILQDYNKLRAVLGGSGASKKTAELIMSAKR